MRIQQSAICNIEAEAMVALSHDPVALIARTGFRQVGLAEVLAHDLGHFTCQAKTEDSIQSVAYGLPMIGRIQEDDVRGEMFASELAHRSKRVAANEAVAAGDSAQLEVLSNEAAALGAFFDKDRFARSPADRLQSDGTGSGEQIHKDRAGNGWAQYVKKRLPKTVRRRTDIEPARSPQDPPPKISRNDAHSLALGPRSCPTDIPLTGEQ